jgi:outer membrane protein OmpA-like peptidoglycan-associated protein/tetratricopeptide (TPR) repeat protein
MKKFIYILTAGIVFQLLPFFGNAQKSKMKLAENYYQSYDFITAGNIYRDVLSTAKYANDSTALRRVADCDRKTGQLIASEGYYKQLIKLGIAKEDDLRSLADVLKFQGKYDEAIQIYTKILEKNPNNDIAKRYVEHPNFWNAILRDSAVYTLKNSSINSASSDFAPGFFINGKVIFSSSRGSAKKDQRIYSRTQQPYLNVYQTSLAPDSSLTGCDAIEDKVNSRYHEGTMAYEPSSNTMFLTRNNFVRGNLEKSKTGKLYLGIYLTKFNSSENTWGELEKFPYNNKEYNVGHPTLNASGNRMYFTSDMPGGQGGADIYFCEKQGETWGNPQNAGTKINTSGDEMFPFMVGDSTLYFASNGQLGLGGLDVFYTNPSDEKQVRNVGYPANSHFDDFGLICFPEETFGYFSSNRTKGKGDDDIYEFILKPVDTLIVSGTVVDAESLLPLQNVMITVPTEDGSTLQVMTDSKGNYTIKAPYKKEVLVQGTKQNYVPAEGKGKPDPRSAYLENVDLKMQKIDYMSNGRVLYAENDAPAEGAVVKLYEITSTDTTLVDSTVVGKNGSYSFQLNKVRKYMLEAKMTDYARQTHAFETNDPNNKIHTHDFELFKAKVGEVVRLDNIYYDYKKWDIRPDAAKELDKLVQIMKDNPTMKIELGSHSDARGSDQYNLDLSDKRAKSAAAYIVSQGISQNRLYGKGYGEKLILNHCLNDVKCTEEEHQFNRRTEFKITAF